MAFASRKTSVREMDAYVREMDGYENSLLGSQFSLLREEISLFHCAGNSVKKSRKMGSIQLRRRRIGGEIAKIPCRFPVYQGIWLGAEFDPDWAHRQPVLTAGDSCALEQVIPAGMGLFRVESEARDGPIRLMKPICAGFSPDGIRALRFWATI